MDIKKKYWEDSYARRENFMFYPKEESVKFLNRFIRKKISPDSYNDFLLKDKNGGGGLQPKGLDFGCGIGRITALMCEFGVDAYGIDISENAIKEARSLLASLNFNPSIVSVYNGYTIPFEDDFFDFTISEGVIDSLPFSLAKKLLKEIERVTQKYFYLSLISDSSASLFKSKIPKSGFDGEITVEEEHEFGTIQSFYTMEKILQLIEKTKFNIIWGELLETNDIFNQYKHGRFHLVLEKKN